MTRSSPFLVLIRALIILVSTHELSRFRILITIVMSADIIMLMLLLLPTTTIFHTLHLSIIVRILVRLVVLRPRVIHPQLRIGINTMRLLIVPRRRGILSRVFFFNHILNFIRPEGHRWHDGIDRRKFIFVHGGGSIFGILSTTSSIIPCLSFRFKFTPLRE